MPPSKSSEVDSEPVSVSVNSLPIWYMYSWYNYREHHVYDMAENETASAVYISYDNFTLQFNTVTNFIT